MGKARIVSGGSGGLYTIEVKYDTTRIDARLADIAAMLPIIQAELDALDTQLATARQALTDAVSAMNYQISLINANKPFDGAYIDGLIGDMQDATSAIENKNIEIDDAYQTLNGYESAIDAATQDETAKRAAYQQAQAALSAYIAETGDTSSGLYLSMVAGVEIKLAAYQDAQQFTLDTKAVFEPQIATQKAEIETLKTELKTLQADYKTINAEFVAVTQAMEAWSKQDQGAIDEAGKTAIQANANYVLTKFKRDEKKREVTELTQEQKWLNKAKTQSSETRQAWCVDLTTNIAANTEVGTIEIAQEQADIPMLIYPGYAGNTYIDSGFTPLPPVGAGFNASRDGALQKLPNMSPESSWFNTALYPAVAKWKPQYRRGTLTAKSGNTGTVALDATYSSATKTVGGITKIAINQSSTLANVPFQYMSCNGNAFSVGDRVIVQFVGRNWSQPFIIGFVDNPKPCPTPQPTNPPINWPSEIVFPNNKGSVVIASDASATGSGAVFIYQTYSSSEFVLCTSLSNHFNSPGYPRQDYFRPIITSGVLNYDIDIAYNDDLFSTNASASIVLNYTQGIVYGGYGDALVVQNVQSSLTSDFATKRNYVSFGWGNVRQITDVFMTTCGGPSFEIVAASPADFPGLSDLLNSAATGPFYAAPIVVQLNYNHGAVSASHDYYFLAGTQPYGAHKLVIKI